MIRTFEKMYLTQSTPMQCRGKIEEIELNNYGAVEDFPVDSEKTINAFKVEISFQSASTKLQFHWRFSIFKSRSKNSRICK